MYKKLLASSGALTSMKREILQTAIGVVAIRVIGIATGVLITVLLGRFLGPEGVGYYAYGVTLITIASIPVSYGWATLLLKKASEAARSENWEEALGVSGQSWKAASVVSVTAFILGAIFVFLQPDQTSAHFGLDIVFLLAAVLFFDQLSANRVAMIRSLGKPQVAQLSDMIIRPTLLAAGILSLSFLLAESLAIIHIFSALVLASFMNFVFGHILLKKASPSSLLQSRADQFNWDWAKRALYFACSSGFIIINGYLDILFLGFFSDIREVGIYRVAAQVGIFAGFGFMVLNFMATPRFVECNSEENIFTVQQQATFFARLACLVAIPIPVVFYLYGETIIYTVFGSEFVAALHPLLLLCLAQVFSVVFGMARSILIMNGYERAVITSTVISIFLNFILCILLIPNYGTIGAAISNVVSLTAWNTALWFIAWRRIGIDTSIIALQKNNR